MQIQKMESFYLPVVAVWEVTSGKLVGNYQEGFITGIIY